MAKKTGNPEKVLETTDVSDTDEMLSDVVTEQNTAELSAEKISGNEPRIWVYLGPSIRGIVTNGRIFGGTRADVVKSLEHGIKEYPQIERLLVADREVAKARNDLKDKRGIYIPYEALTKKITGKED